MKDNKLGITVHALDSKKVVSFSKGVVDRKIKLQAGFLVKIKDYYYRIVKEYHTMKADSIAEKLNNYQEAISNGGNLSKDDFQKMDDLDDKLHEQISKVGEYDAKLEEINKTEKPNVDQSVEVSDINTDVKTEESNSNIEPQPVDESPLDFSSMIFGNNANVQSDTSGTSVTSEEVADVTNKVEEKVSSNNDSNDSVIERNDSNEPKEFSRSDDNKVNEVIKSVSEDIGKEVEKVMNEEDSSSLGKKTFDQVSNNSTSADEQEDIKDDVDNTNEKEESNSKDGLNLEDAHIEKENDNAAVSDLDTVLPKKDEKVMAEDVKDNKEEQIVQVSDIAPTIESVSNKELVNNSINVEEKKENIGNSKISVDDMNDLYTGFENDVVNKVDYDKVSATVHSIVDEVVNGASKMASEMTEIVEDSRNQISNLRAENKKMTQENNSLKNHIKELESDISSKKSEISDLNTTIGEKTKELKDAYGKIKVLEEAVTSLSRVSNIYAAANINMDEATQNRSIKR